MAPGERALVFVRTREGAAELADALSDAGLPARAIHGDMEQRDRTRTLAAFRAGAVTTLVATDVAARGLDVADVTRVIHADPPGDAEVLTHRSGRTGRAGKKGTSILLVPPGARERVKAMLHRAGVEATWSPAPSAGDVLRAADERLAGELLAAPATPPDPRLRALAEKLLASAIPPTLVTALLARAGHAGPCAPADVTPILPPRAARRARPPRGLGRPIRSAVPERRQRPRRLRPLPDQLGGAPSRRSAPAPRAGLPARRHPRQRRRRDPHRDHAVHLRGRRARRRRLREAARRPDARDPRIRIEPVLSPARAASDLPAHGHAPPRRRPTRPR